jgi:hypothetical protein
MALYTDGYQTLIHIWNFPNLDDITDLVLAEKTVTPIGLDAGGPIDQTTMRNVSMRTNMPKKLVTLDPMTVTAAYDPRVYPNFFAILRKNRLIQVQFPDRNFVRFWGYVDKFKPAALKEGEQPTAEITFQPTNLDRTGKESPPSFTATLTE